MHNKTGGFHQSFDFQIWRILLIFGSFCCVIILFSMCWTCWKLQCTNCNKTSTRKVSSTRVVTRSSTASFQAKAKSFTASRFYSKSAGASASSHIECQIKALGILSLMFFLFADIASHCYIIFVKLPPSYSRVPNSYTLNVWTILNSCWSLAYGFTYLLFFERLRRSFVGSVEQLSVCTIVTGSLLIVIYIVLNQAISVCWLLYAIDEWTWEEFDVWYRPLLWSKFCVDWIFNAFLVYLFCSKIYKITLIKEDQLHFRNHKSFALFNVMIKYFLLTFCTVLSTQIYTISEIILSSAITNGVRHERYSFYYRAYAAYFMLGCIDSMVSTVYIMLTFPFGHKWYQTACGCCHRSCIRLWTNMARIDPNDEHIRISMRSVHTAASQTDLTSEPAHTSTNKNRLHTMSCVDEDGANHANELRDV